MYKLTRKKFLISIFFLQISNLVFAETFSEFVKRGDRTFEVRFIKNGKNQNKHVVPEHFSAANITCEDENEEATIMYPSWTLARDTDILSTDFWTVQCLENDVPIEDCFMSFDLVPEGCDGRHSISHSGTRPAGHIVGFSEVVLYDIPLTGLFFEYVAPDVSGDVTIEYTIYFPGYSTPWRPKAFYRIGFTDLVDIEDTPLLSSYLIFDNITSHDYGTYGVSGFGTLLQVALQSYVSEAVSDLIPNSPNSFYPLKSEGASLQFGGLFDIDRDWDISHKRHRQGVDIDIGMSLLKAHTHTSELMDILDQALRDYGFIFDVRAESILAYPSEVVQTYFHWHVRYPFGETVPSNEEE